MACTKSYQPSTESFVGDEAGQSVVPRQTSAQRLLVPLCRAAVAYALQCTATHIVHDETEEFAGFKGLLWGSILIVVEHCSEAQR